uniref:GerAB/ArcD/ProY family transporter n=1 Tax=Anaerobutyricum hallii TaxID=39488 RepID=UPI003FEF0E35
MYENKISARQLRRMIFIETFGAGALSIPAFACYKEQNGFWSLIFYGVFLTGTIAFFIIFSGKISEENFENRKIGKTGLARDANINVSKMQTRLKSINFPEVLPQPIKFVYMIRFFINAVALFYFFGKTIQTVYMPESSFLFIIFPAAILLCYSLYTTLQKRARFLEIIFPWIITTYFIAVILSFIGIEKAMQIGNAGEFWQGILSDNIFRSMGNGYLMLLCSSPIEFLLFLRSVAEERGTETKNRKVEDKNNKEGKDDKAIRDIITAVAGAILCNVLFCFLSVRTLGPTLTSQSEWPVIKMMQLIRMPGGFLERFDILPIIFWILCMMAVLSGYLYYGWSIFQTRSRGCLKNFLGITFVCLVLLTCVVEKHTLLWTFYLKYKAFVDFPLSLILPLVVWLFKRQKDFNYQEKTEKDKEERKNIAKYKNNKQVKYFAGITLLIFFPILFSLTGCQRLTDVEEKNYILSMYVDYPADEENAYQFWIARANLSEMEGQSDEIPCQITKIEARNLQQLEEKYLEIVPGKTEWNHIYTIFLGSGIAANKTACTHLLKEWDNEWQKSPNVLLALCPENPKELYKIKNIPAGAAGQEINLLAEQNKEKYSGQICETPIDYLRAKQQQEDKITLYRVTIENGNLKIMTDEL